jgi:hypothetical protein
LQSGALNTGLSIDTAGLISGSTTDADGTVANFTIRVTDETGLFVDRQFTVTAFKLRRFVAVGSSGDLSTSTDGITWTARTSGFGIIPINAVTYGNNLYVAVGGAGILRTSPDGITWTARTSGFGTSVINGVTYGDGLYVAVGNSGRLTTSPDGITWTNRTSGFGTNLIFGVTYGDGLYVAVGNTGRLITSPDGITWTAQTTGFGSGQYIRSVGFFNGLFLATADGAGVNIATSLDGITWTTRTTQYVSFSHRAATFGDGLYLVLGSNAKQSSSDAITWTQLSTFPATGNVAVFSVTYGNGLYLVGGEHGVLATSPNIITWTGRDTKMPLSSILGLTYG